MSTPGHKSASASPREAASPKSGGASPRSDAGPVEIAPDTNVEDESYDTDEQISTASLRSSILQYRVENGRTYHKLSDGKYVLPNDDREQERLDLTHHLFLLTHDGALCLCPKAEAAKRVLDIGCGTGSWSIDYADAHPEAEVIGVDLSPIQPSFVPPNCKFEVDDIEKEWLWEKKFDLIFARSMIASIANWETFFKKAYECLEPGGYLEVHDNCFPVRCDDETVTPSTPIFKWTQLLIQATDIIKRPITVSPHFKEMMEAAGFVDVEMQRDVWPINKWARDPKLKELGMWAQASSLSGVEGMTLALFTRVLGWSAEETMVFCGQVRKDFKNLGLHGYWDVYTVYGRKPEAAE